MAMRRALRESSTGATAATGAANGGGGAYAILGRGGAPGTGGAGGMAYPAEEEGDMAATGGEAPWRERGWSKQHHEHTQRGVVKTIHLHIDTLHKLQLNRIKNNSQDRKREGKMIIWQK